MSLEPPEKLQKLRAALHAKAKRFRKWWGAKHKNARFGPCWYWSPWLERTFGLLQLRWDPSRLPHANA